MRVLTVIGTRPEAIKMMPVLRALKARGNAIESALCVTAQHRELLDQVLTPFALVPDYDLDVMKPGQSLNALMRTILERLDPVLESFTPDVVLVHGDTTTTLAAALAAFYRGARVAHVEAGLRSGDLMRPWPEEMNRRCVDQFASWLFAPTQNARRNLLAAGVADDQIVVTGNTAIDALHVAVGEIETRAELRAACEKELAFLDPRKRLILVTGHRRESFGDGIERICAALLRLASRGDVEIVYPIHPNPNVRDPVRRLLGAQAEIHLVAPMDYLPFVALMARAHVIITDSGGIQEEAPSLKKPLLVTRERTERPEIVETGQALLVGSDEARIVAEAERLLDDAAHYEAMARGDNPFGDGRAAERIVAALLG